MGNLYLTNRRLFLIQGTKLSFEVYLKEIEELEVLKRRWILGVRVRQLGMAFRSGRAEKTAFMGLGEPERWREAIKDGMILALVDS